MKQDDKDPKTFLSPAGALLAAICFFLPWVRACGRDLSGAQMASESPIWWLVLLAALAILGLFYHFSQKGALSKLKPFVAGCCAVALFMMVAQYFKLQNQIRGMFDIRFGGVGSFLGFLIALAGLPFLQDKPAGRPEPSPRLTQEALVPVRDDEVEGPGSQG